MINWKKRFHSKAFWVAIFSMIALTGQVFNVYQVPNGWETWVNSVLTLLTLAGIITDPTTDGFGDVEK